MIGTPSARASRSAHNFRREPRRGVFAPHSSGTVPLTCSEDLDLLLDDLSLSSHFQLGRSASRLICQLDTSSHWRQLLLPCMQFVKEWEAFKVPSLFSAAE